MHTIIHEIELKQKDKIKYRRIRVIKGNIEYHYICVRLKWNFWLNRYYPLAELTMIVEHLK